jgi:hypothetical protein
VTLGWKLRREARRIRGQLLGAPRALFDHLVMPAWHERVLRARVRVTPGALAEAPRVAIYLMFPALGVQPSHLRSLRYLAAAGYAPLVVSNLAVEGAAREQLLGQCWQLMERPNFGHDFGGYREAMLWLAPRLGGLERLCIFNDSSWFPLPGARDWLADAEALGADVVGASAHHGTRMFPPDRLDEVRWHYDSTRADFHYGSFALLLRDAVLRDAGFLGFWRGYRPRNRKSWTIRHGEVGFTQWAMSAGHSHAATMDVGRLHEEIAALDDAALQRFVEDMTSFWPRRCKELRQEILSGAPFERDTIIRFVLAAVSQQGVAYTLARYALERHGYTFLKKSLLWMDADAARQTLEFCRELPGEAGREILAEAQMLNRTRLPHAA